jgi:hypothetical protein
MYQIPKPQTLDPYRPLGHREIQVTEDGRPGAELLATALQESCRYAEQLWENLNAMRLYLLESLPPDPRRTDSARGPAAASPTGPDDETGWNNWINAFAAVTSVLCGPQGDSGFGLSRAHEEANARRSSAVGRARADRTAARQPSLDNEKVASQLPAPAERKKGEPIRAGGRQPTWTPTKIVAVLAVGALTLRELRLRRPSAVK